MNDIVTREEKIAGKIDTGIVGALAVSNNAGGINFTNAEQVLEVAKMMAISNFAVPKHLRANPGACLGIVVQAIEWRMSAFAVANKSYVVNDRLAYEAQLIHAVVLQRAPIDGRIKFDFRGDGANRSCRTWAKMKGSEEIVEYCSPRIADIKTKNSPLWAGDPDQQLGYFSVRAFCRRHFPEVLMGVYSKDELEEAPRIGPDVARDVTPKRTLAEKLNAIASGGVSHPIATAEARLNDITGIEEDIPQHDPETGEISDPGPMNYSGLDTETAAALLAGKLAARNGQLEFKKWWRRLSAPEVERVEPYLEELHAIIADKEASND